MKRSISFVVLLLLTIIATRTLHAQDQPVAVLSIKSADRVLHGIGTIGRWLALNGTAEEQQTSAQMMRSMVEPQLASFDKELAAGAVVWLSPEGMPDVLAFLPVADATPLLNGIAPFVGQPEPAGDALKFGAPGMPPVFVQTKGSWTFVAMSQQRLESAPADPSTLLGPLPRLYDLALRLKVQAVPAGLRDQLIDSAKETLPSLIAPGAGAASDGFPGDEGFPDDEPALIPPGIDPTVQAAIDQQIAALRRFLNETDQLVFGVLIDDNKQELRVDFIQKAVEGSPMAKLFNGWRTKRPTEFAGFYRPEAGFHMHANMKLAPETVASWTKQIDDVAKMALNSEGGPPVDDAQKEVAATLINVLKAFISGDDTDLVVSLSTLDDPSLLLAGKVSDVASVNKAISLAEQSLANVPGVTMRKETVGGVPLSVWSIPIPDDAAPLKDVLGPNLELAAGVSNNSAYVAAGGASVLKKLEASIGASATPLVRSPVPGMILIDVRKLVSNLDIANIPGAGEWAAEIAKIKAPLHFRLSTVPANNSGIFRVQVGAGLFTALAPRPDASSPFDDAGGAFGDAEDVFNAPAR